MKGEYRSIEFRLDFRPVLQAYAIIAFFPSRFITIIIIIIVVYRISPSIKMLSDGEFIREKRRLADDKGVGGGEGK